MKQILGSIKNFKKIELLQKGVSRNNSVFDFARETVIVKGCKTFSNLFDFNTHLKHDRNPSIKNINVRAQCKTTTLQKRIDLTLICCLTKQ